VSDGLRFGSLLAYLHEQEPESIDLLIGQIYAGVRRAAALDYELPPEFVSRPEYTAESPPGSKHWSARASFAGTRD